MRKFLGIHNFLILFIYIMARHRSRRYRSRRHSRSHRGGGGAADYANSVVGSANSQFSRTFDQAGAYGQVPGNLIIGTQGQNVIPASQMPTSANLSAIQNGGRRRRRGGFFGEVVNQAIVPFALVGMQNTYRRKRGGRRHTRRHHRRH